MVMLKTENTVKN